MEKIVFTKYTNERNPAFRIITRFVDTDGSIEVQKLPACEEAGAHLEQMYNNYFALKKACEGVFEVAPCHKIEGGLGFDYIKGKPMSDILDELVLKNDMHGILELFKKIRDLLSRADSAVPFTLTDGFRKIFGDVEPKEGVSAHSFNNLDMMLTNLIMGEDGKITIIDYEWCVSFPVPDDYIIFRMIYNHSFKHSELAHKDLLSYLGFSEDEKELYLKMENNFMSHIVGDTLVIDNLYRLMGRSCYSSEDIKSSSINNSDRCIYQIYYDMGNGYNEQDSLTNFSDGLQSIHIRVPFKAGCQKLRLDPAVTPGSLSSLRVRATSSGMYEPSFTANGNVYGDTIVFSTDDPQIEFKNIEADTKYLDVYYSYRPLNANEAEALARAYHDKDLAFAELESSRNTIISVQTKLAGTTASLDNTKAELENTRINLESAEQQNENLKSSIDTLNLEKESVEKSLNEEKSLHAALNVRVDELYNEKQHMENTINELRAAVQLRESQFFAIQNSRIWRHTEFIRKFTTFLRANTATRLLCKGILSLKNNGIRGTADRVAQRAAVKNAPAMAAGMTAPQGAIGLDDIKPLDELDKTIAIHLHLFYEDLLDEFIRYFNNIPYRFDLFVSCRADADQRLIRRKLKKIRKVGNIEIKETINRGRDIAPLYVQFGSEIEKYDYFLHCHSKKSLYTGKEQYGWRQYSMDCLMGSEELVKRVFALFESDKKMGLFYPETYRDLKSPITHAWLGNAADGKRLLNEFGIEFEDGIFNYPAGSFFWAKTEAVRPLFDKHFKYEDFSEEAKQTDGTLAHALERVIAWVCRSRGYIEGIYDNSMPFVRLGRSLEPYQPYFRLDSDAVQYHLGLHDLVSFDIFDTLITRLVYEPDDVFEIMRIKAEREIGLKCDYLAARKQAEAFAWQERKEFTNIHDIYSKLPQVLNISAELAERLKNMEIELELALCVPRKDMLKCFNYVKASGKKIILVSDMYLTKDIVEKMLKKCGYSGYDELWLSCEMGKRKDSGGMWDEYCERYKSVNTVHVGDNPRSDNQLPGDRKRDTVFAINPRMAFMFSKYYSRFKPYFKGSVADRLIMGMFINGAVYNSPFACGENGEPVINNPSDFGFAAFGGLFATFSLWLNTKTRKDDVLMFLAREGYMFEKIYNNVFAGFDEIRRRSCYTLASRRAVSVAAVRDREDIAKIIGQYYDGMLDNMLKARLGIDIYPDMVNRKITNLDNIMQELEPHIDDILQKAKTEREAYELYLKELGVGKNGIIVDVGYSGTIQYFMAKLRNNKQAGLYLCTQHNRKPMELGCRCEALYQIDRFEDEELHPIFRNQLFLEAALKAPYGQLICFKNENGRAIAQYKDDSVLTDAETELQSGVLEYSRIFGNLLKQIGFIDNCNKELVAEIFSTCINGGWMGESVQGVFVVQDDYCSNGNLCYDAKQGKWIVN